MAARHEQASPPQERLSQRHHQPPGGDDPTVLHPVGTTDSSKLSSDGLI